MGALARIQDEVGYDQLLYNDQIGKVSLIPVRACARTRASGDVLRRARLGGVNIEMISTSEIRISVIVDETQVDDAVRPPTPRSTSTPPRSRLSSTAGRAVEPWASTSASSAPQAKNPHHVLPPRFAPPGTTRQGTLGTA